MRRWCVLAAVAVLMGPGAASAAELQQLQVRVIQLEAKVRGLSAVRPEVRPLVGALRQRVLTLELQVAGMQQAITRLENRVAEPGGDKPR